MLSKGKGITICDTDFAPATGKKGKGPVAVGLKRENGQNSESGFGKGQGITETLTVY